MFYNIIMYFKKKYFREIYKIKNIFISLYKSSIECSRIMNKQLYSKRTKNQSKEINDKIKQKKHYHNKRHYFLMQKTWRCWYKHILYYHKTVLTNQLSNYVSFSVSTKDKTKLTNYEN